MTKIDNSNTIHMKYHILWGAVLFGTLLFSSAVFVGAVPAHAQSHPACDVESDLRPVVDGVVVEWTRPESTLIEVVSGGTQGRITAKNVSTNPACVYTMRMAAYEVFEPFGHPNYIETQELFDDVADTTFAPGEEKTFVVNLPTCNYQIDVFEGPHTPETNPDFGNPPLSTTHTLYDWVARHDAGVCTPPPPPEELVCTPSVQTVGITEPATVSVSGGSGPVTWTALGGSPGAGHGPATFTTQYSTAGAKTIWAERNGETAFCNVIVTSSEPEPARLTIIKTVNNNHGGTAQPSDFEFTVTEIPIGVSTPLSAQHNVPLTLEPGDYHVAEEQLSGYEVAVGWGGDCAELNDGNGRVSLLPGDDKVCTITNRDVPTTPFVTDVSIVKSVTPGAGLIGDVFTYELTYRNEGDVEADNTTILDIPFPDAILDTYTIITQPPHGSCVVGNGEEEGIDGPIITCDLGTLASGDSGTVTYTARAIDVGAVDNHVRIDTTTPETDYTNNEDEEQVTVTTGQCIPPAFTEPVGNRDEITIRVGEPFTYNFRVVGDEPLSVELTGTLPNGLSFSTSNDAPNVSTKPSVRGDRLDTTTTKPPEPQTRPPKEDTTEPSEGGSVKPPADSGDMKPQSGGGGGGSSSSSGKRASVFETVKVAFIDRIFGWAEPRVATAQSVEAVVTGTISGTPTQTGTFDVVLSATNDCGVDSVHLRIIVIGENQCVPPTFVIPASDNERTTGRVGEQFSYTVSATHDTSFALSVVSGLPSWAVFEQIDDTSSVMKGTPDQEGTHEVVLRAEEDESDRQCAIERTLVIEITDGGGGCTSGCGGGGGGGPNPNVFLFSDPQVLGTSISLAAVPYTGVGEILSATLFILGLVIVTGGVAYSIVRRKKTEAGAVVSATQALSAVAPTVPEPRIIREHVVHDQRAQKTHEVSEQITHTPMTAVSSETTALEQFAAEQQALISTEGAQTILAHERHDAARAEATLANLIDRAKGRYATEDGWLLLNQNRISDLLFSSELSATPLFIQWIVEGNQEKAFGFLRTVVQQGQAVDSFLRKVVAELDRAYQSRLEGSDADSAVMNIVAPLGNKELEGLVTGLVRAVDGGYTTGITGAKVALTRLFEERARAGEASHTPRQKATPNLQKKS